MMFRFRAVLILLLFLSASRLVRAQQMQELVLPIVVDGPARVASRHPCSFHDHIHVFEPFEHGKPCNCPGI